MSRFATLLAALTATGAAAAPAAPEPGTDTDPFANFEMSAEDRTELAADLRAFVDARAATARQDGFKAANDRALAVLGSDKGKANPTVALALLGNDKLTALSAEDIIAAIPDAPAAEAAAAAEPAAAAPATPAARQRLEATPKVTLGNRGRGDTTGEDAEPSGVDRAAAVSVWGSVQGKKAPSSIVDGGVSNGQTGARVEIGQQ